jgi:coenzyme PQQ synthesis protein D (PqqD)
LNASHPRVAVNSSVICADLEGEAVLLDIETGMYFGLDAVGTRIWTLLEQGASEGELLAQILEEYAVEPDRLKSDLSDFLAVLQTHRLARVVDN